MRYITLKLFLTFICLLLSNNFVVSRLSVTSDFLEYNDSLVHTESQVIQSSSISEYQLPPETPTTLEIGLAAGCYLLVFVLFALLLASLRVKALSIRRMKAENELLKSKFDEARELYKIYKERAHSLERQDRGQLKSENETSKDGLAAGKVEEKQGEVLVASAIDHVSVSNNIFFGQMTKDIVREIDIPLSMIYNGVSTLKFTITDLVNDIRQADEFTKNEDDQYAEKSFRSDNLLRNIEELKNDALELMEGISENAYQAKSIISKLGSSDSPSNIDETLIDLNSCLDEVLEMLEGKLVSTISVKKYYDKTLPGIKAPQGAIHHAFVNFLLNAIQAIPENEEGAISIYTENRDNLNIVRIHDTGTGISSDDMPNVFEPFFTTKQDINANGLGLSISNGIVKENYGEIRITSYEGKGTEIEVTFPVTVKY